VSNIGYVRTVGTTVLEIKAISESKEEMTPWE